MDMIWRCFVGERFGQLDFRESFSITPANRNDSPEAITKVETEYDQRVVVRARIRFFRTAFPDFLAIPNPGIDWLSFDADADVSGNVCPPWVFGRMAGCFRLIPATDSEVCPGIRTLSEDQLDQDQARFLLWQNKRLADAEN